MWERIVNFRRGLTIFSFPFVKKNPYLPIQAGTFSLAREMSGTRPDNPDAIPDVTRKVTPATGEVYFAIPMVNYSKSVLHVTHFCLESVLRVIHFRDKCFSRFRLIP
jgi:hypothetical protein